MVPSVLSEDLHRRIKGSELIIYPDSGHGGIFQFHEQVRPRRRRVPRPLTSTYLTRSRQQSREPLWLCPPVNTGGHSH